MALEQPNNQVQPMAQRPPVGDGGGAMPNQGDAMPNQQAQGQDQSRCRLPAVSGRRERGAGTG